MQHSTASAEAETLDELLDFCRSGHRVAPAGKSWQSMWKLLLGHKDRKNGLLVPLILGGAVYSDDEQKRVSCSAGPVGGRAQRAGSRRHLPPIAPVHRLDARALIGSPPQRCRVRRTRRAPPTLPRVGP